MADTPLNETAEVVIVGGTSNNDYEMVVNSDGSINVNNGNSISTKQTYSAGIVGLVPPASATDIFTITGSATKTIRIQHVSFTVSTTAGSGLSFNASLLKRSTANSGGTSTTPTPTPHDSDNSAATAVVRAYTANPTVGTLVGLIHAERATAVTQGADRQSIDWHFPQGSGQEIVLRGTSQVLAINFNSTTITGPVVGADIQWTEE